MSKFAKILIVVVALVAIAISAVREHNIRGNELWFGDVPTADLTVDLRGKTVVVTGANAGIGAQSAAAFKAMGAKVILACRSLQRGKAAMPIIDRLAEDLQLTRQTHGGGSLDLRAMDLASFESISQFVDSLVQDNIGIDILLNNAGVMNDNDFETEDGLQVTMGVNHFGVFRLTLALLNAGVIKRSEGARIVNVASNTHAQAKPSLDNIEARGLGRREAYACSKLANIAFTQSLAEKLDDITVNVNHPGFVATDLIYRKRGWLADLLLGALTNSIAMDAWQGAQNSIHLATSPSLANTSGRYFSQFFDTEPTLPDNVEEYKQSLWQQSVQLTGIDLE